MIKLTLILSFINCVWLLDLQHVYHSNETVEFLITNNEHLFRDQLLNTPKYFEQTQFDKKLEIELMLRVLTRSLLDKQVNDDILTTFYSIQNKNNLDFLTESTKRLINQTWLSYCSDFKDKCFQLCRSNQYKPNWCLAFHDSKHIYKRNINTKFNLSNKVLINSIVNELIDNNIQNSFIYMNNLADTSFNKTQKCQSGFISSSNQCIDLNECNTTSNCDLNAQCINTFGSFKCRCRKGYLGTGLVNSCFSGTFCSGKFCRLNGKCVFNRNRGGYKCECMLNCLNGGICVKTPFKYECKCPMNTTGSFCNQTLEMLLNQQILNPNRFKSNVSIQLSQLVSLVQPLTSEYLNKSHLNKYYSILNKFFLLDSYQKYLMNKSDPIQLFEKTEQSSLIKPVYYENELDYNDYY